ncbi:hypothetical protein Tco_0980063 [Tanacetum coccineum]
MLVLLMIVTLPESMANAEHAPAMASPVPAPSQYRLHIINNSGYYLQFDSKAGKLFSATWTSMVYMLNQDTLRDALQITPVDNNQAFSSPPTPDTLVEFVNKLGTSGFERPRARATIHWKTKRKLHNTLVRKKKATLILIPSIRFTKLIIFHLQRLHNFYPRPDSPLHLPTEEPVLGHLKFSAKMKRDVFGRDNTDELINNSVRGANDYAAYLEKVAKHQPKPKEKKRKPVSESSEDQPLAKRAKAGKSEEAIQQKVLEESLDICIPTPWGSSPSCGFRGETNTGKITDQLPECQGKGKEESRGGTSGTSFSLTFRTPKKKFPPPGLNNS